MRSKDNQSEAVVPEQAEKPREPLAQSPEEACMRAYVLTYAAWPQIISQIVEKASKGSLAEAKFLLETYGLATEKPGRSPAKSAKAESKSSAKENEPSDDDVPPLARLLMETLNAFDRGELKSS
jgi:hypothetical protein